MKTGTNRHSLDVRSSYDGFVAGLRSLLEQSRRTAARSINAILTVTYWEIGRRTVEFEQRGAFRAKYGANLIRRLSKDLTARFGRGFSAENRAGFPRRTLA